MKNLVWKILLLFLLAHIPATVFARTEVHLFDFSDSYADCKPLMKGNMNLVRQACN